MWISDIDLISCICVHRLKSKTVHAHPCLPVVNIEFPSVVHSRLGTCKRCLCVGILYAFREYVSSYVHVKKPWHIMLYWEKYILGSSEHQ